MGVSSIMKHGHTYEEAKEMNYKYQLKYYGEPIKSDYSRFTLNEINMILRQDIPDKELSKLINHSIRSIQIKRSRLKKKGVA